MSDASEIRQESADRVTVAARLYLRKAATFANPERDVICRSLALSSDSFRRAHTWVTRFEVSFAVGTLLALFGVFAIFGDNPRWVPAVVIVAALIILGIPAIKVYRVAWQSLDVAVGACAVANEGGESER